MAQRKGISSGTTAQRSIEEAGKMRFNTSTNLMEYYDGTSWKSIDSPPLVSSVSPANLLTGDGTGNYTIVVTGSSFSTNVTAEIITDGGVSITPDTTTRNSSTQATLVVAKNKANLTNANEPFDVKISNTSGLAGTLADALNIDAQPVFSTAAGSLGTISDSARGSSITILAADPESGGDVVYTLESGTLPAGASLASQSSGAVISGFSAVGSNTTSNFTIRAKDAASNVTDRAFSITVNAPQVSSFTSSGTFSVPSGVSAVNVLVVAGGGSGGMPNGGGGGAGGLIYRPAFPVSPGGTVTVTIGDGGGGQTSPATGNSGQDSVFGTLTAKGGGGGGGTNNPSGDSQSNGAPGGSAGGGSGGESGDGNAQPGSATQPTQSGESGNYGFGNVGNIGEGAPSARRAGAGGGGAGGTSGRGCIGGSAQGGAGGVGKAYTIADGTTSVYYAGGGGGGSQSDPSPATGGSGGQGGGGDGSFRSQGANPGTAAPGRNATANRGGGGGGGASNTPSGAGSGGKGVVIVAY